jgi:predicted permease
MTRVRYAVRSLAKTPLLSVVVVVSLGLGIGANTAIFSLLHQMVLRSLPVEKPEDLALVTWNANRSGSSSSDASGGIDYIFSYRGFRELEERHDGVDSIAAFRRTTSNLAYGNQTTPGTVMLVSGGYFPLLRVTPSMGRLIVPDDDAQLSGNAVAVLSYAYWRGKMGAEVSALNRPMRINGQVFTIVGVAPNGFSGTSLGVEPDVFVPLSAKLLLTPDWKGAERLNDYWLYLLARRKPGVTLEQASVPLNGCFRGLIEEQAKTVRFRDDIELRRFRESRLKLVDGRQGYSYIREKSKTPIQILMIATGLVLLIAMANAANLMLARSGQRRKEIAIRAALGASRGEIFGQILTEGLLLAGGGAVAGFAFGAATVKLLISSLSGGDQPIRFLNASMEWPILLYALGVSAVTGLLFGLYPAWDAARNAPANMLNQESGRASAGRGTAKVRRGLVCAQVMISAVLLIPAGLLLMSLVNLLRVDLGIRTENVAQFGLAPMLNGYKPAQSRDLFERAESALAAMPGVTGVASAQVALIGGDNWMNTLTVEGYPSGPGKDTNSHVNQIGPGFFGQMGIPLLFGREFTERDNRAGQKVAIVNEQFARYFFGNANPLGRKFTPGWGKVTPDIEIVGVVKDSHYAQVNEKPVRVYYTPWRQSEDLGSLNFYLRSALPPSQILAGIRRVVLTLDPSLPPMSLRTLEDQIRLNIQTERLELQLASTFAILATVLAMLGLYGVTAYSVTRRTREIGIRVALGAAPGSIRAMVMRETLWILGIGLATGVPAALFLAKYAKSQLYGVTANDPIIIIGAVLALCVAAALAGFIPALRASRVNPLDALRYE